MTIDIAQSLRIEQACPEDMRELLELQYAAYRSEALLYNNYSIQPLTQTFEQAIDDFHRYLILKAIHQEKIVGSVRAHEKDNTVQINKLIVMPSYQNQGIGKYLMKFIESFFSGKRYELFTGGRSWLNLALYKKLGYEIYQEKADHTGFVFAYLAKSPASDHLKPSNRVAPPPITGSRGRVLVQTTFPESTEERYKRLLREKGGRPSQMEPCSGG